MRSGGRRYKHLWRWLVILVVSALCLFFLVTSALNFLSQGDDLSTEKLLRFGFSALTALVYLAVGSLVWLFGRRRSVARLLFVFSLATMVTFANEMAGGVHGVLFVALTGISSVVALASFALLLLLFPYDYLAALKVRKQGKHRHLVRGGRIFLGLYMLTHLGFAGLTSAYALTKNVLAYPTPAWLDSVVNFYYAAALACILLTTIGAYVLSHELRTRQQVLLFVVGAVMACAPLFFLTILPQALELPNTMIVNGQWSSLPLLLLPLALGYAVLRYQILIYDLYIRRAVAWTAGVMGLAVLCYAVVILSRQLFTFIHFGLEQISAVATVMALLGPLTWWLARWTTERLFFPEFRYYHLHMQQPELLTRETFDLNKAAELLLLAMMQAFETQEVCLYVLDERTGYFHLAPTLEAQRLQGTMRGQLLWRMASFSQLFGDGNIDVIEARHPLLQRVADAQRPLFLHEALESRHAGPTGLSRYLVTSTLREHEGNPLLVSVRAQGKMIGLLCLGERGDGQMYAGPDFEFIHLLLARFSSILETARLYVQASRHVTMLNTLYSASSRLERTYMNLEEVATAYAQVAAEALLATAEIWLYVPERLALRRVAHTGQGPVLLAQEWIAQLQEQDWTASFQEGRQQNYPALPSHQLPTCLAHLLDTPFAWLPLCQGQKRLGVLVISFASPHVFALEEKRILGMFTRQCAAALENAQITIALRAAYERQKELDQLKDQFIMTASHELRTPLTALQGYIELLSEYNHELSVETRRDFIQKAQRGCDELALMVGNIMDASYLQHASTQIHLVPVELAASVRHVIEILEAVTTREKRAVNLAISPGLFVQADELRLRQILLNLMSNALKYSPAGSTIQILALQGQGLVKISVRDYGLGIPPAQQGRLFERFVRLERDINSSVRGAGLGLYITKRLVEAMNGRLWVESSGIPGEGSTFSFTLQRAVLSPRQMYATVPLVTHKR